MVKYISSIIVTAPENHEIRIFHDADKNAWFVAQDVAQAMGFKSTRDAICNSVPEEFRETVLLTQPGHESRQYTVLDLRGVFHLIQAGTQRDEQQRRFLGWFMRDVLPNIQAPNGWMCGLQLGLDELKNEYEEKCNSIASDLKDEFDGRCEAYASGLEEQYAAERDALLDDLHDADGRYESYISDLRDSYEDERETLISELRECDGKWESYVSDLQDSYEEERETLISELHEASSRAEEAEKRLKTVAEVVQSNYV